MCGNSAQDQNSAPGCRSPQSLVPGWQRLPINFVTNLCSASPPQTLVHASRYERRNAVVCSKRLSSCNVLYGVLLRLSVFGSCSIRQRKSSNCHFFSTTSWPSERLAVPSSHQCRCLQKGLAWNAGKRGHDRVQPGELICSICRAKRVVRAQCSVSVVQSDYLPSECFRAFSFRNAYPPLIAVRGVWTWGSRIASTKTSRRGVLGRP